MNPVSRALAKTLDIGQRLLALFLATALPAITTGSIIGVSVAKSSLMAGAMAVITVVQRLASMSVDGDLTAEEIKEAFSSAAPKKAAKPARRKVVR